MLSMKIMIVSLKINSVRVLCCVYFFELFLISSAQSKNKTKGVESSTFKREVAESIIRTIRNCYQKDENIVMVGDWSDFKYRKLNKVFASMIPIRLIGLQEDAHFLRHRRLKNVYKMNSAIISKKKYPGNHFIIMASSINVLESALDMLKESVMWNHEGFFLIICRNHENDSNNANSLLRLAWSFNILSATVLSYDENYKLRLYTFNPYMNLAPNFWNLVKSDDNRDNDPWTLYHRELDTLQKDSYSSFCKYQNFDKTSNLNGYSIKMGAYINPKLLSYDKRKTGLAKFGGINGEVSNTIWSHVNATGDIHFYSSQGFVNAKGMPKGYFSDLMTGDIEYAMNMNMLRDFWKLQSYPHETDGLCMVSRKDLMSSFEQFHVSFNPKEWVTIAVMSLILMVTFKYLMKQTLSTAALELFRMILSAQCYLKPDSFIGKTVFMIFVILTMVVNMDFQSKLTSFDVVPNTSPTIDSVTDLVESQRAVYGSVSYSEFLSDLKIKDRYRFQEHGKCVNQLLAGKQVICISTCHEAKFNAFYGDLLHVSKEFRRLYMSFSMIEDWPLQSRFNEMLRRLSEAGLMKLFSRRESYKFKHLDAKRDDYRLMLNRNVKMDLEILVCGLIIAIFAFWMEICFYIVKEKFKNISFKGLFEVNHKIFTHKIV